MVAWLVEPGCFLKAKSCGSARREEGSKGAAEVFVQVAASGQRGVVMSAKWRLVSMTQSDRAEVFPLRLVSMSQSDRVR